MFHWFFLVALTLAATVDNSTDLQPQIDAPAQSSQLVLLDAAVPGASDLIRAIPEDTPIYQLRPELDGVDEISDILLHFHDLEAIHIIAYGRPGELSLGAQRLDRFALAAKAHRVEAWGRALAPEGDLLIYGSETASGEDGARFVALLSAITGADVAASNSPTGNAGMGGDWSLEVLTGRVEAAPMFNTDNVREFQGLLAAVND
jgi:hypothetical protein